jgi:hypothetical protein
LAGKKEELLERIDSDTLLRLAESVSESPMKSDLTRAELLKIVKESLSIEEIRRKAKLMGGSPKSGKLTERELTAGGVGQISLAISSAISNVAYYLTLMGSADYRTTYGAWNLVGSAFFVVFVILLAVSVVKITRKIGGGRLGAAICVLGSITATIGVLIFGLMALGILVEYSLYGGVSVLYMVLMISYAWLLGITVILFGAFFLVCREFAPSSELWLAGGVLYIVSGAAEFSIYSLVYPQNTLFTAAVIGAVCFLMKKVAK